METWSSMLLMTYSSESEDGPDLSHGPSNAHGFARFLLCKLEKPNLLVLIKGTVKEAAMGLVYEAMVCYIWHI